MSLSASNTTVGGTCGCELTPLHPHEIQWRMNSSQTMLATPASFAQAQMLALLLSSMLDVCHTALKEFGCNFRISDRKNAACCPVPAPTSNTA